MKEESCLLRLSVFGRKATQLGFLASLLIIMCAMLSCEQAELTSSPSEGGRPMREHVRLLRNLSPKAALLPDGEIGAEVIGDQTIGAQFTEALADRVVKIGLIMEAEASVNPQYGAELAMFEINQDGGVLGLPIKLLTDAELTKYGISDDIYGPQTDTEQQDQDIYGPRLDGNDQDGDISGPSTLRVQGEIVGGILGFPIGLIVKDNEDDPALSAKLAEELITQDGVVAIIGPGYSRNALRVAPVAQSFGVPMVATTATNPDVTLAGDFAFLAAFADMFQGEVMARFARESLKANTAAILTERGDPYSEGLSKFFEENFTAMGGKIVVRQTYLRGETDFTAQLTAIAAKSPDAIFMPGFKPEVPMAIRQARVIPQRNATGITATFLGGDGWDEPDLVQLAGSAIEGSYFSTLFSPDAPDGTSYDFARSYQARFGMRPDVFAAMGYDALKLVAMAIRRAGSLDREAIRDQLAATQGYQGATCIESYNESRHPTKSAIIMRVRKGRVEFHQEVGP